ncbi:MAG TPA: CRISPR-associated endonuclease Cas1 [Saprospiraceae bacterium]|nr:CRISPR-associated endonuclease Cas1 [Saprospiraceae bacterium]
MYSQIMQVFINTFGTSLKIIDGLLSVKFEDKVNKIPIGKIKTLFLTKSIYLSTDVIYACLEQGIDLLITDRTGRPLGRLWNNRFGSISTIRKRQLDFAKSPEVTGWVINQLTEKIDNQVDLLFCLLTLGEPHEKLIRQTAEKMQEISSRITDCREDHLNEAAGRLRALEGQASKQYFSCVNKHLPFRYQFAGRSRHPALDMVNAMLNYAYGILYGHVESALIKAGLDPFIGFFHRDDYNKPVLTYDVIEPFRPWADWVVFHLCFNEILEDEHFDREKGAYWLAGDAKRFLIQHFTDFFEEVVEYREKRFSRFVHLERAAQLLSAMIQDEPTPENKTTDTEEDMNL